MRKFYGTESTGADISCGMNAPLRIMPVLSTRPPELQQENVERQVHNNANTPRNTRFLSDAVLVGAFVCVGISL